MITILAEKPSQARQYIEVLRKKFGQNFDKKDGFYQSKNYFVTNGFGHLIALAKDTAYRKEGNWSWDYLPLIPKDYEYNPISGDAGVKNQLKAIKYCLDNSTEIINATDADREGELIFYYIYDYFKCNKPVKRLWLNSLSDNDIANGFKNLKAPNPLFRESAYLRAIMDWVIGVNGTQAATLKLGSGNLLTIGRVQSVILKLICEKYLKNKNFNSLKYYRLRTHHEINGIKFIAESTDYENKKEAETAILNAEHTVKSFEQKKESKTNPLLYSINSLTIDANKYLNMKSDKTLEIAQKLYEKKLMSYPRTDNEYINEEIYNKLKNNLLTIANSLGIDTNGFEYSSSPRTVNEEKMDSSHDALVPTGETNGLDKLLDEERKVYELVVKRALAAFENEKYIVLKSSAEFENNSILFSSKGRELIQLGWKKYQIFDLKEGGDEEDKYYPLPVLSAGNQVKILDKEIREVKTAPPRLANVQNLISELSNVKNLIKDNDLEIPKGFNLKDCEIGTQSTRTLIIKRLENLKYIQYKGKSFIPTELGLQYYEKIKNLYTCNYFFTVETEIKLKSISDGEINRAIFLYDLGELTKQIVDDIKKIDAPIENKKTDVGVCPKCKKGHILENKKGYSCSEWKQGCDFGLWQSYFGKKLTKKDVQSLLTKGATSSLKFKSKNGNPYMAKLILDDDFKIKLDFDSKR
ncbi:DNA topoisomerase [Ornithobacterium rhinotracheale]